MVMRVMVVALISLSGCASSGQGAYVGQSIDRVIFDHGQPDQVTATGPDRRDYIWQVHSAGVAPVNKPVIRAENGFLAPGNAETSSDIAGFLPFSRTCTYTIAATSTDGDWIVDSVGGPADGCA